MITKRAALLSLSVALCASPTLSTEYQVTIDTSGYQGQELVIAFDLLGVDSTTNTVTIRDFIHDGDQTGISTLGGPVAGDLVLRENPAVLTTLGDSKFLNHLGVILNPAGATVSFTLEITENVPVSSSPDEISFFVLDQDRIPVVPSDDPLGTSTLFAICVDGTSGGDLAVFDPATFVPPSSIVIGLPTTEIFSDGFESGNTSNWSSTEP